MTSQSPLQLNVSHWPVPFAQSTRHGPAVQVTCASWHALSPWHWTSQPPGEQPAVQGEPTSPRHALLPVHETVQPFAWEQSTPAAQLCSPEHTTLHGTPAGQVTTFGHSISPSHVITHTPAMSQAPMPEQASWHAGKGSPPVPVVDDVAVVPPAPVVVLVAGRPVPVVPPPLAPLPPPPIEVLVELPPDAEVVSAKSSGGMHAPSDAAHAETAAIRMKRRP